MNDLRRRLDQRVDAHLDALRQRTERLQMDSVFADQVMLAVSGQESIFLWLGVQTTRRSFVVCSALVALAIGWAVQSQTAAASAMVVATLPLETPW